MDLFKKYFPARAKRRAGCCGDHLLENIMKTKRYFILLVISMLVLLNVLLAQQLAFPTAEGSGRYATGGRGGDVYEVTNLSNSGPGSIVDAVSAGNRTIVFRVSGTIALGSVILKPKSNTTIAGQTAPGDGICIKGRISIGSVSNIVIRYIRVRVDAGAANSSGDAIDIDSGINIIIDHVTASYARDEGISCQEGSNNVTVQWCIISEALTFESHSYGSLVRGDFGDKKTYHHNLYAHNNNRNPRPGNYTASSIDPEGLYFDFRNNVVYNWKGSTPGYNADTASISRYNFIGNVYISGSESGVTNKIFKEDAYKSYGYFADNMYNGIVLADQWSLVIFNGFTQTKIDAYKARSYLIPMEPVTTTSPAQAKNDVLASAGSSYPKRDTIDNRIVNDVLNGTGRSIVSTSTQPEGGWPVLNSVPAPADVDQDGMPDDWETAQGLDPNNAADRNNIRADGYTQLEAYLCSLTGEITTSVEESSSQQPKQFVLHQNYPNPFNPSTTITFSVGTYSYTSLRVYDIYGREVATLVDGFKSAGSYTAKFNGSNLSSGVYFARLHSKSFSQTIKLILAK
jgi:pectate lyase